MAIPYKLFMRMTDMADEADHRPGIGELDRALVDFQDEIGWPFKASQEQIDDWNRRRGCDCQCPEPISGAALVSMDCPVHG